jgi:hypothetical protein
MLPPKFHDKLCSRSNRWLKGGVPPVYMIFGPCFRRGSTWQLMSGGVFISSLRESWSATNVGEPSKMLALPWIFADWNENVIWSFDDSKLQ